MDASYRVQLNPPPPEGVLGGLVAGAIGDKYARLLTEVMTVIPRYVDGIDKTVEPFLNELITALQGLGDHWKGNTDPDEKLLANVIGLLEHFESHSNKTVLLYPQIEQSKPLTASPNELEDIQAKKIEAEFKTRSISIDKVVPLLRVLKPFEKPSLGSQVSTAEILQSIGDLKIALEAIVDEQRTLLAKVVHAVKTLALEAIQEGVKKFRPLQQDPLSGRHDPLMHLLRILGKYQRSEIYLPSDRKKEIESALLNLESSYPKFKGLYESFQGQGRTSDLEEVHRKITTLIKDKIYGALNDDEKNEFCRQVARFAKMRQKELIEVETFETKKKKEEELKKAQQALDKLYSDFGSDNVLSERVKAFTRSTTAADKKKKAFDDTTNRVAEVAGELDVDLQNKIDAINNHTVWVSIDLDRDNWGKKFLSLELKNIPQKYFTEISRDEIVWKAAAYHLQKMEWQALNLNGAKNPKDLLKALERALTYINRLEAIEEGLEESEKNKSIETSLTYVIGWMDYAKVQMIESEQNSWEKTSIEKTFEDVVRRIRKGEVKRGIKEIQDFIRGSNYWKRLWQETPSPLSKLEKSFEEFYKTSLPAKPPKSAAEVHKLLNHDTAAEWRASYLTEANKLSKEQVIESSLGLISFEYVAFLLGLNGEKATWYKKVVETVDKVAALQHRSDDTLKGLLNNFIGPTLKNEKQYLEALKTGGRKQILIELLNILINEKGSRTSAATWAAWSSFSLIYDLIELFIRPFSEQIFNKLDELLKNASGGLNQNNLVPIKAVTKGLATYQLAMEQWSKAPITGTKDDLSEILKNPKYYEGLTPSEVTRYVGYRVIDQIKFPDYTGKIDQLMEKVKEFALMPRTRYRFVNVMIYGVQGVVAVPAYVTLLCASYVVRVITHLSNIALQRAGKLYLWKTDFILKALDRALGAVFTDVESAPILDTLLLEQLQELVKELEKGAPPSHSEAEAGDEVSKKAISEAIQYLFEVIEEDQFESLDGFRNRSQKGIVKRTKGIAYEQLKKLFATVLVSTSKSLLQKEQVEALLFELFKISKESLQGGKGVILTQEQSKALQDKHGRPPTEDEVSQEGKRISLENLKKIPDVLTRIRNLAINPAIDVAIDKSTQTSSQTLLDYTSWIQTRLVVKNSSQNMVQFLKKKLFDYKKTKHPDILREIHFKYGQFIQEMRELQVNLDNNPSPLSPELNEQIETYLTPHVKNLTESLTNFLQNSNNDDSLRGCVDAIINLKGIQVKLHTELGKLEESEKNRVIGMQVGVQGIVNTNLIDMISRIKERAKNAAHAAVQFEINNKVEQLRNINKNKIGVKHLILWQMRLFLNPELAFKV